jgi:hypothetical protein
MTAQILKSVTMVAIKAIGYSLFGMVFFTLACSISWTIMGCLRMLCAGELPSFNVAIVAIDGARIGLTFEGTQVFIFTLLYTCYFIAKKRPA